jgi:hypothetical protein
MNLTKKSTKRTNGDIPKINSNGVTSLLSFVIRENMIAMNIKYKSMHDTAIYTVILPALF